MALISNGNRTEWSTIRSVILTTTTTAVKTSLKKEFAFFQTQLRLFGPAHYVKCRRLFLEKTWILTDFSSSSSKRGRKIRRLMSTSSIKRQIRRFHVVVVQWTSRKRTKKRNARAELLFWSLNLLFFWRRRCGRRRSCLSSLLTKSDDRVAGVRFCLITSMITERVGRHEGLLPINHKFNKICDKIGYFSKSKPKKFQILFG